MSPARDNFHIEEFASERTRREAVRGWYADVAHERHRKFEHALEQLNPLSAIRLGHQFQQETARRGIDAAELEKFVESLRGVCEQRFVLRDGGGGFRRELGGGTLAGRFPLLVECGEDQTSELRGGGGGGFGLGFRLLGGRKGFIRRCRIEAHDPRRVERAQHTIEMGVRFLQLLRRLQARRRTSSRTGARSGETRNMSARIRHGTPPWLARCRGGAVRSFSNCASFQ